MAEDPDRDGPEDDEEPAEPLGGLAERIRARRSDGPAEDDLDRLFQSEPYDETAVEELWAALEGETTEPSGVEAGEGPDEHIVPKRAYCETCEYFSEPPEVHCTHAGTTIVEYVDIDHVRVRNCPIVAQRQALGERDEGGMTQMSFGSQGQD